MLVLFVKIVNFPRVGLNVVADASNLKIIRDLPEPVGPTSDMKSRSFENDFVHNFGFGSA